MIFTDVLLEVLNDQRITRKEWKDKRHYVLLKDDLLQIHKAGEKEKKTHPWIISDADLMSDDWELL